MTIVTKYTPQKNMIPLLFVGWPPRTGLVGDVDKLVGITAKVLLPMTKLPEAGKSTGVPAIFTPGPPAVIVVPSIDIAVGLGIKTSLPIEISVGLGVKTSLPIVNTVGKA